MPNYHVCDFTVESNIEFPIHAQAAERPIHLSCYRHSPRTAAPFDNVWLHERILPDGGIWLSIARTEDGYLLRFPGLADFTVSADGRRIDCHPRADIAQETINHLLLDQVIPALLAHEGELALHAGGVASDRGAIVFLGESGWGKSTLCASFNQAGFPLLGDDFLLLRADGNGFAVVPSYPGLRLWPDSRAALAWDAADTTPMAHYATKERLDPAAHGLPFRSDPASVTALFALAPPAEGPEAERIRIQRLPPREAYMTLLNCAFQLDGSDRERNRRLFQQIANAVDGLNIYSLAYPREMPILPDVRAAILTHLATDQAATA